MKKSFFAVAVIVLLISGAVQATIQTYSIVDYPIYQIDTTTGLTDHVSGTILADPDTGTISSAAFTITNGSGSSYTVASATIDSALYVHISPTQITVDWNNPSNPTGYGNLRLSGTPTGTPPYDNAVLQWYTPSYPWVEGNNTIAAYTGTVYTSKTRGAEFSQSVSVYPPQAPVDAYPTWVVAVVPEPMTMLLLGLGAVLLRKKK